MRYHSTSNDDGSSGHTGCTSSRSPFETQNLSGHHHTRRLESSLSPNPPQNGAFSGGDVLLQWGHKKRSRISRTEIRASAQPLHKAMKRAPVIAADNLPAAMPPPPAPRKNHVNGFVSNRSLEDQSVAANGSLSSRNGSGHVASRSAAGKRSLPFFSSSKDVKTNGNGSVIHVNGMDSSPAQQQPKRQSGAAKTAAPLAPEKTNVPVLECPRIFLALSRKEKEDDFLVMKGTKLPQRPKKRAKNVDKALQYCYPGMWLADLTRSRYEVREKKTAKKQQQQQKRRGLKGMESLDSDSY